MSLLCEKITIKISEKTAIVLQYISATLLNVWLNGRLLDSYICFCIHSVGIYYLTEIHEGSPALHRPSGG